MKYKDSKGMENILIFSKNLIKTFSARADEYLHPFGTCKDILFAGFFYDKGSKVTPRTVQKS